MADEPRGETERQTLDVIERYLAAREINDQAALETMFTDDVVWILPNGMWNDPEPFVGKERALSLQLPEGKQPQVLDRDSMKRGTKDIILAGDRAIVTVWLSADRLDGTGTYHGEYLWIYTVTDGRISRMEEWADTLYMANKGVIPSTPNAPAAKAGTA